jgi:hypothetical protein
MEHSTTSHRARHSGSASPEVASFLSHTKAVQMAEQDYQDPISPSGQLSDIKADHFLSLFQIAQFRDVLIAL